MNETRSMIDSTWALELISGPLAFFIGVFSGVTAHFIGSWVWMWYKKPSLDFLETRPEFDSDESGNVDSRVYMVQVKNTGRQAAVNCKPEFELRGTIDGDKYVIQSNSPWSEGQNPARLTINQGEIVSFPLFKLTAEQEGQIVTTTEFKIQFPANEGWVNESNILKWIYNDEGQIENAKFQSELTLDQFQRIIWDIREVRVTSKNAKMKSSEFEIISDVEGDMGLTGMQLKWL